MCAFILALFAPVVEPWPVDRIKETGLASFRTAICGLDFRAGALSDISPPLVHCNVYVISRLTSSAKFHLVLAHQVHRFIVWTGKKGNRIIR